MVFPEMIRASILIFADFFREAKIFGVLRSFTAVFTFICRVSMQAAECVGVLIIQSAVLQRTDMKDMIRADAFRISYHE